MAITTPNMSLMTWDQLGDFFSHTDLRGNFVAIDAHDHTSSKGVQVPGAGIANGAIGASHLVDGAVTTPKIGTSQVTFDRLDPATVQPLMWQIGDLKLTARATAPTGWLFCDGSAVSRTTFASLFGAISTNYGVGDGSTSFNLPDFRGRVGAGPDNMGTAAGAASRLTANKTLGAAGGVEQQALATGNLPAHNHGVNDPGHAHTQHSWSILFQPPPSGPANTFPMIMNGGGADLGFINAYMANAATGITTQNTGSGTAHNNMQPFTIINMIIKT